MNTLFEQTNILMVNTNAFAGGAARAAWRTFTAIRTVFPQARYLTLFKEGKDRHITGLAKNSIRAALAQRWLKHDQQVLAAYPNRIPTDFTPGLRANPFRKRLSRHQPALIHLHWIGNGMSSIDEIGVLDCPIIWTLHDTWAFTGGCHYPGNCTGFQHSCGQCPQLNSKNTADLSHTLLTRKTQAWSGLNLTIVTPSHWMANLARQSQLFQGRRIDVIPNGLDTDTFRPIDRQAARQYFNLPKDQPVLLFGAQNLHDDRKGADLLVQALMRYHKPCTLLLFGHGQLDINDAPWVTIRRLGTLVDDASLSLAYSAADVFACPSREDNLPNTVAEALACGTPCLAFNTHGLPEMITHQGNGWLARPFEPDDLAAGITWLCETADKEALRHASRAKALNDYNLHTMSDRYASLYVELLQQTV